MKKRHLSVVRVGCLVLLVSVVTAAMGCHVVGASAGKGQTYSGDDAYDPAAGGNPDLSLRSSTAGRDLERSVLTAGVYSGDDAYDPAANSKPDRPVLVRLQPATLSAATTFGGDDAYDPAAGAGALVAFALSEDEISARAALAVDGGFSGDDAYDPAAGGTPELSLVEFIADAR